MARLLLAQSFYISLLTWLGARRVLEAGGLPIVNLMFDGGGRAILLLLDDERIMARVQEALKYLDEWFAERLGGILRLDVAVSRQLIDADFTQGAFDTTIRQADQDLAEARLRQPGGGLCDSKGWTEDGWMQEKPSLPVDWEGFREAMGELGQALPKASFISLDGSDQPGNGPRLDVLGYQIRLHSARPSGPAPCFALRLDADEHPISHFGGFLGMSTIPFLRYRLRIEPLRLASVPRLQELLRSRLWDDTINAMEKGSRNRRVGKKLKEIIQL